MTGSELSNAIMYAISAVLILGMFYFGSDRRR